MMFSKEPPQKNPKQKPKTKKEQMELKELFGPGHSMILPPTLTSQTRNQKKGLVFNPLDYEWFEYTAEAADMMNDELKGQILVKDAGVHNQLFWFFNGIELLIWNQTTGQSKKYRLPQKSQIIALGQLQNASLHFKNQQSIIVVAGMQNCVNLFAIDKQNFSCTDFKMHFKIQNSSYVQKVIFLRSNKIVIASNTGQHFLFDFTEELKIYRPEGTILKNTLPYLPLLFPKQQRFCEGLLASDDYIISLVREEKKKNWLSFKTKQLINYVTDSNFNQEWIIEQTRVEIYRIDKLQRKIFLVHTIKEEDIFIKKKTTNLFKTGQEKENSNPARIVSINFQDKQSRILEIVTQSGTFTQIDLQNNFIMEISRLNIPNQNSIGQVDFYLMKKDLYEEAKECQSRCLTSLGTNNLTLTQDSLWYISQNSIELVKSNGFNGKLLKSKKKLFMDQQWILLTKKGYFKIKRLQPRDLIAGFIAVKDNQQQNFRQRWLHQTYYKQFLSIMSNSIGQDKVIQSLMQAMILPRAAVKLSSAIMSFIKRYLDQHKVQNYRDWYYELHSDKRDLSIVNQQTIQINRQDFWKLILQMQNKQIKVLLQNEKELHVGAYWQALKNIFYKTTRQLFSITPDRIKINKSKIDLIIHFLENMLGFFDLKKVKTVILQNKFYLSHQQQQPKQNPLQNNQIKQMFQNSAQKKLSDSFQTQDGKLTEDNSMIESSLDLQKQLIYAISKIKYMVEVFFCLAESKKHQKLANLRQILKSDENQRVLKYRLIETITDKNKLREIHAKLPSLQLDNDLNLLDWFEEIAHFQRPDLIDLKKVGQWLSSYHFTRTLKIFENRIDFQIQLLLFFRQACLNKITRYFLYLQQEKKRSVTLYGDDIKNILEERIAFYNSENEKGLQAIYQLIKVGIKNYTTSTEDTYFQSEKVLDNIIFQINSQKDKLIKIFIQEELKKTKVSEKINMVARLKQQPKPRMNTQQYLQTKQARVDKVPLAPRQLLSNYQSVIAERSQ